MLSFTEPSLPMSSLVRTGSSTMRSCRLATHRFSADPMTAVQFTSPTTIDPTPSCTFSSLAFAVMTSAIEVWFSAMGLTLHDTTARSSSITTCA